MLLAAAVLKWIDGPTEGWGIGPHFALVVAEVWLRLALLCGTGRRVVAALACVCFLGCAGVNVVHLAQGYGACGCFGAVRVSPWITLALDLTLAAGLGGAAWFTPAGPARGGRVRSVVAVVAAVVLTGVVVWPAGAGRASPTLGELGTASGNLVVLEPEGWAGKPFALAGFVPGGAAMAKGRWVVLLYHNTCSTCQHTLPAFESELSAMLGERPKVALVEVPPHEEGDLNATLAGGHDWFATTPIAVAVEDGVVRAAAAGENAGDPAAFLHKAGFEA